MVRLKSGKFQNLKTNFSAMVEFTNSFLNSEIPAYWIDNIDVWRPKVGHPLQGDPLTMSYNFRDNLAHYLYFGKNEDDSSSLSTCRGCPTFGLQTSILSVNYVGIAELIEMNRQILPLQKRLFLHSATFQILTWPTKNLDSPFCLESVKQWARICNIWKSFYL